MTKLSLIWALVAAAAVGAAGLTTGYLYMDRNEQVAEAPTEAGQQAAKDKDTSGSDQVETTEPVVEVDTKSTDTAEASGTQETLTFDVVGVEPSGDTVVAGRSEPGAIVALTANGKVVGKGLANGKGEWTIILDKPLAPGDYDVGLEVQSESGEQTSESKQRLAVSVPQDGKDQPLVVLNSPNAPSDILQKPAAAAPDIDVAKSESSAPRVPETVAAAPDVEAKPAEESSSVGTPKVQEETVIAAVRPETSSPVVEEPTTRTPESPAKTAEQTQTVTPAAAPTESPSTDTEVAALPENTARETSETVAPISKTAPVSEEAAAPAVDETAPVVTAKERATAAVEAEPPVKESAPGQDAPRITVDAVESEKGKVFVAGTGEPGSTIRIYVGDEYAGDVKVGGNGRWLFTGKKVLEAGNVEVRADVVDGSEGAVLARAAVTFEKEQEQIILTKVVASGQASGDGAAEGAAVTKALPNVIIRKGDNLWRISRRLYGDGVRYTTIYQANRKQIRNPDLIYPGQVFLTPEGDLNWKPQVSN